MLKKINDIKNLPIILFFILVLNLIPLAVPNIISKESQGANTIFMIAVFAVQIAILIYFFYNKIKFTKEIKVNFIILSCITGILLVIQAKNLIIQNINIMDIANIISKFFNILLLYIAMLNIKIEEVDIVKFLKAVVYLGVVAGFVNFILYGKDIITYLFIKETEFYTDFKSFFGNRNQFSFFLYITIITNFLVMLKDNKLKYKLTFIFLIINLFLGLSRTAILATLIFFALSIITTTRVKGLVKVELVMIAAIIFMIGFIFMTIFARETVVDFFHTYVRPESICTLSGRTSLWGLGLEQVKDDWLVGIGRFKGIEAIKEAGRRFTQFHNTYIELLVSGGIIELISIICLYFNVYRKMLKSDIDKKIKNKYMCFAVSYFIYMMSESLGRFSLGFSDTICMLYFITIPVLYANSKKEIQQIDK